MKTLDLTLLYLRDGRRVLLAMKKRGFGMGKWNGVGGKVEPTETVHNALVRECQEEIGVTPRDIQKVGYLIFNEQHEGERKLMNLHIFTAVSWQGTITESEEMNPQWFRVDSLPWQDMWPADQQWLPMVLDDKKVRGTFTLNDDSSVKHTDVRAVETL